MGLAIRLFGLGVLGLVLCACGNADSLDAQQREMERIDALPQRILSNGELNEAFVGASAIGETIIDVFPEYLDRYELSEEEISVIGEWHVLSRVDGSNVYVFLPNGIFVYYTNGRDADGDLHEFTSVGEWWVRDEFIGVNIEGFLRLEEPRSPEFVAIQTRSYVIGRESYIHESGYLMRPFLLIDFRNYVETRNLDYDNAHFDPQIMYRLQYTTDLFGGSSEDSRMYGYLNLAFILEESGTSNEEFFASTEIIEETLGSISILD